MKKKKRTVLSFLLSIVMVLNTFAGMPGLSLTVYADPAEGTLITAATSGSTLSAGTYYLADDVILTAPITLGDGAVINGNNKSIKNANGSVIIVSNGIVSINNLTIKDSGGENVSGSALEVSSGATAILRDSVIKDNTYQLKAAINLNGMVLLDNCGILGNESKALNAGGVIQMGNSSFLYAINTAIKNNIAGQHTGGINNYGSKSKVYLIKCRITGNTTPGSGYATSLGGAIRTGDNVYAINCVITGNKSGPAAENTLDIPNSPTLKNCVYGNVSNTENATDCSQSNDADSAIPDQDAAYSYAVDEDGKLAVSMKYKETEVVVIHITAVTIDPSAEQEIDLDGSVAFTATVAPENATDKKVKWTVGGTNAGAVKLYSDSACTTEVGTAATSTLTVYAKGISAGNATVTVTSNADSTKSASCAVTVNAGKQEQTITVSDVTAIYGDTDKRVSASVTVPETGGGAISYAVKDGSEDYIEVASDGTLTIKAVPPTDGKAYVIVTAAENDDYTQTTKEVTVTISAKITIETKEDGSTVETAEDGFKTIATEKDPSGNTTKITETVVDGNTTTVTEKDSFGNTTMITETVVDGNKTTVTEKDSEGNTTKTTETVTEENTTTVTEKNAEGQVTKTTENVTKQDGSKTETVTEGNTTTVTEKNAEGLVTKTTETVTKQDGSKTETVTEGNTTTVTEKNAGDQVTKTTETVTNQDGSKVETVTEGNTTTVTEKNPEGDTTKITETVEDGNKTTATEKDPEGNTTKITETVVDGNRTTATEKDPEGNTTKITETVVDGNKTTVTEKDPENHVIKTTETVTFSDGSYKVTETKDDKTTVSYYDANGNIIKDDSSVVTAPTAKNLTYTGSAQELVTAGEATGGTMYYALGTDANKGPEDKFYTTSIPVGTNAGIYYVWHKTVMDSNHLAGDPVCITVEIKKAAAEVKKAPAAITGMYFTGRAQELIAAGEAEGGKLVYSLMSGGSYSEMIPTAKDIGDHTVYYKVAGDANHYDTQEASLKITIAESPKNPKIEVSGNKAELHMVKGEQFDLPEAGWEIREKGYVSISKAGVIKAKKVTKPEGVKIEKDGRVITVFVTQPAVGEKKHSMKVGETWKVPFTYDAAHLSVQWHSDDQDAVTIDDSGLVTATGKGKIAVYATVRGVKYKCTITVKEDETVFTGRTIHMLAGKSKAISIKGQKIVSLNSADPGIVSIDKKKIKAAAAGETTVTAYTKDGKEYKVQVYVEDIEIVSDRIKSTNKKNVYTLTLKPGETVEINYKKLYQKVSYKSKKTLVAYESGRGAIVANNVGKTVIQSKINGKTVKIKVTVQN